jgi:hypothetical protein
MGLAAYRMATGTEVTMADSVWTVIDGTVHQVNYLGAVRPDTLGAGEAGYGLVDVLGLGGMTTVRAIDYGLYVKRLSD